MKLMRRPEQLHMQLISHAPNLQARVMHRAGGGELRAGLGLGIDTKCAKNPKP